MKIDYLTFNVWLKLLVYSRVMAGLEEDLN